MKLHRQLLFFSIGLLSMFSASAQELLPHKATYNYVREVIHVSPDVYAPYVFFEERLLLDSQVSDTAYYTVRRRTVSDHNRWYFNKDDVTYYLTIHDSVIYFTGNFGIGYDSSIYLKREIIFDLKLREGDSLGIKSKEIGNIHREVLNVEWNETNKTHEYEIEDFSDFDGRFGFRTSGLLPIDIIGYDHDQTSLISVCTDSLIYYSDDLYWSPLDELVKDIDFCDSIAYRKFISDYIAAGIDDNPSTFQFSAFPNPFTSHLQIDTEEQMRYSIRSLQGQEILSGQTDKTINTETLAKGIYLLQIESKDGMPVKKIIKR